MKSGTTERTRKRFVVVVRGPAAFFFHPDDRLIVEDFPSAMGPVNIAYTTRWLKKGDDIILPGHLWIEIRGHATTLEDALVAFGNAALSLLPIFSLSANAAVDEPEIELGFDNTPGATERDYFQCYLPPETEMLHVVRRIKVEPTVALLKAVTTHPEAERLLRGANQYRLALDSWRLGRESLALAHLWMALEAITKTKLRAICESRKITEIGLASSLGIIQDKLDSVIRRDFLLQGDIECYKKGKQASDGFEHGFLEYDKIREHSKEIRHRMASYLRRALFELCNLAADVIDVLTTDPNDKPLGYRPVVKYFRGKLVGEGDELSTPGSAYPFMRWTPSIKSAGFKADGRFDVTLSETLTAELAEGIKFRRVSHEVWKAG